MEPSRQFGYHTTNFGNRESIFKHGLRMSNPAIEFDEDDPEHPTGVYYTPEGEKLWDHSPESDVWRINLHGLRLGDSRWAAHDYVAQDVPISNLALMHVAATGILHGGPGESCKTCFRE